MYFDSKKTQREDGTWVEEVSLPFEPNVVIRRPCPPPKTKAVVAESSQEASPTPVDSNSLKPTQVGQPERGTNGTLKKKRKGKKIRRVTGRARD